jgi:tetratricopeptide (TPR) repeat protein
MRHKLNEAIDETRAEAYLKALTLFNEYYSSKEEVSAVSSTIAATGLSYFGLCMAMIEKKYKPAIELCKRAIELQFYNGDHYANLSRVYLAAGNRKKALETAEAGLKLDPEHEELVAARRMVGVRARPAVPFLDRKHPINVTLGQSRHAKKADEKKKKPAVKKKSEE